MVVRAVLQAQRDRGRDAGSLEDVRSLGRIRSAVAVAVEVLQHRGGAGESVRNERVERGVGALVDLLGDRLAVDERRPPPDGRREPWPRRPRAWSRRTAAC